jgi:RNA polymerase sigma factor (sigma-70 family)
LNYNNIEEALLAFKGNKNQVAFKYLYQAISKKVYFACIRYMNNSDDAQDVLQETFITVFQKVNEFKNEGSFEGWVKRIAVNKCLEKIRAKKLPMFSTDNLEAYQNINEEIIDEIEWNNKEMTMMQCLSELPENYRIIINMAIIESYSHQQIAAFFGISESNSRIQLMRAKQLLKAKINNNG